MEQYSDEMKPGGPINPLLVDALKNMLNNWHDPVDCEGVKVLDAVFAYRLLLGRNPSQDEVRYIEWASQFTLRDFLAKIKASEEFKKQVGHIPPSHVLMAELPDFRFWFDTTDVEMGVRMGFGNYEPETIAFFRDVITPGMTCWDVGAQTGFFTCLFSKLVGERGMVVGYEPRPQSFRLLEKNIAENGFDDHALGRKVACSDAAGHVPMVQTAGMFVVDHASADAQETECVRLDQEKHARLPDLIKIDVEGHEPAVLRGLEGVFARCNPLLVLELNGYWLERNSNTTGADVIRALNDSGFKVFRMEEPTVVLDWTTFKQGPLDNCNVFARRTT